MSIPRASQRFLPLVPVIASPKNAREMVCGGVRINLWRTFTLHEFTEKSF
jgi:hypothetical protein